MSSDIWRSWVSRMANRHSSLAWRSCRSCSAASRCPPPTATPPDTRPAVVCSLTAVATLLPYPHLSSMRTTATRSQFKLSMVASPFPGRHGTLANLAAYARPLGRLDMCFGQMIAWAQHQQRLALMGSERDREGMQIVDLTDLLIGEHVDQHAAWYEIFGLDAARDGLCGKVQDSHLLGVAELMNHHQHGLVGH